MQSKPPIFVTVLAFLAFCFAADTSAKEPENARVSGTLNGKQVNLTTAKYDKTHHAIEIYAGNNWGWNDSLLIFLFKDLSKKVAPGNKIQIDSSSTDTPHIHRRVRTSDVDSEIIMSDYKMTLHFADKRVRGYLPAKIKLSIPKDKTNVSGDFYLRH